MGSTTNTNYASHTGSVPAAGSGYNAQTGSGYAPADASGTHGHATKVNSTHCIHSHISMVTPLAYLITFMLLGRLLMTMSQG